jgi:3-vinyl bacteriochlorophyllide hydratase
MGLSGAAFGAGPSPLNRSPATGSSLEARFENWIDSVASCPWPTHAGLHSGVAAPREQASRTADRPLYTPEERKRRDQSPWTLVQGILAPLQFVAFAISLALVLRYLTTGEGAGVATASVIVKTMLLYTIMITGSIWEKVVFGKYLFAPAFFWEDVFSMLVLALHTAYLAAVLLGIGDQREQMLLALAAYATYAVNAGQFVWKLRMARLQAPERAMVGAAA